MALTTQISFSLVATHTSSLDLGTVTLPLSYTKNVTWASGTGADQADMIFTDQRSTATNEDLDLAGALTNAFGATMTFAKVKAIIVYAATGNTGNVQVTRPASNGVPFLMAAGDGIALRPGAFFAWFSPDATGVAVTATTGDLINVASSSGTSTYDVIIIGTSA